MPTIFVMKLLKPLFLIVAVLVAGRAEVFAQNNNNNTDMEGVPGFWEIETSGGRFTIQLDDISSVSEHTYIIDGAHRVYECTVDSNGSVTARFYFIEPVTAQSTISTGTATIERLREVANKIGEKTGMGEPDSQVHKNYPTTTHARTSEYRLKYKDTIAKIYDHIYRVWALEKGRGKKNKLTILDE